MRNEDLIEMVKLQEHLNIAYCGEDWRLNVPRGSLKSALIAEYGEFLAEVEYHWKWWKQYDTGFDLDKATFEFVDTLHFMLGLVLQFNTVEVVVGNLEHYAHADFTIGKGLDGIALELTNFLRAVDTQNLYLALVHLKQYANNGADWLDITDEELVKAYKLKNSLNFERACGGADYDRSKERTLSLR